jgi:DNA invertase Pin-like site-specific DNA recombinase
LDLIVYARVSTQRQKDLGLGFNAQRNRVLQVAKARGDQVVAWFTETERGRRSDRPELDRALIKARHCGAIVVVAKLDSLARDAELVQRLAREADSNGFGGLLCADLPDLDATTAGGRKVLSVMASVVKFESRRISERTRELLTQARARGEKLGAFSHQVIQRSGAAGGTAEG